MSKVILYIGRDVHQETIAVSIAPQASPAVRRCGIIGGTLDAVDELFNKLARLHHGNAAALGLKLVPAQ